jgi:hypothetical protein
MAFVFNIGLWAHAYPVVAYTHQIYFHLSASYPVDTHS